MIAKYGADTVRLFCLFAAPPERDFDWSDTGIEGASRFLNRIWRLYADTCEVLSPVGACSSTAADATTAAAKEVRLKEHLTVKKAGEDIGNRYQFNTAIAAIMELVNALYLAKDELATTEEGRKILSSAMATVLTLLAPSTPHVCEELWEDLGHAGASIRSPGRYGRKTPCSAMCSPWSSRSTASCAARSKYPPPLPRKRWNSSPLPNRTSSATSKGSRSARLWSFPQTRQRGGQLMNRPHPASAHAGYGRLYRLAAGLLSGLLVCLMLTGCGYVWRGQEGSLSENSVLGNGSKTLKIKSVEQTSLYPWLTYQVRSLVRDDINARNLAKWVDDGTG